MLVAAKHAAKTWLHVRRQSLTGGKGRISQDGQDAPMPDTARSRSSQGPSAGELVHEGEGAVGSTPLVSFGGNVYTFSEVDALVGDREEDVAMNLPDITDEENEDIMSSPLGGTGGSAAGSASHQEFAVAKGLSVSPNAPALEGDRLPMQSPLLAKRKKIIRPLCLSPRPDEGETQ